MFVIIVSVVIMLIYFVINLSFSNSASFIFFQSILYCIEQYCVRVLLNSVVYARDTYSMI